MSRAATSVLALALAFGLGAAAVRGARAAPPRGEARALDRALARAVERASPALVRIRPAAAGDDAPRKTRTGVVLEKDLVVTDALSVPVFGTEDLVVVAQDGKPRKAKLRGRDLRHRLVALVVEEGGLTPIAHAAAAPETGALCLALGGVLASDVPTATFGVISATARFDGRALETDALVDPSNAGGPLVDVEGRLLGVTVVVDRRIGDGSGVGFAVPIDRVGPSLERLRKGDELEQGFLGIVLPSDTAAVGSGVKIEAVRPGGPAARSGVQTGDVIEGLELEPGKTPKDTARVAGARALLARLSRAAAGDTVRLHLRRGKEEVALNVRLAPQEGAR